MLGGHAEGSEPVNVQAATVVEQPVVVGQEEDQEITVDKQVDADGKVTATVTISTKTTQDEVKTEEKVFTGTDAEVNAKIEALKKSKDKE